MGLPSATKLFAQTPPTPTLQLPPTPVIPVPYRSTVSLVRGDNRRKLVYDSLVAIDRELAPALKRKKSVLLKVNLTSVTNQLASTHPDTVAGVLDYLGPRFKGPVVVGEAASNDTMAAYENFKYSQLVSEFKSQKVSLVDFNLEKYALAQTIDSNLHPTATRIAARLVDPDAFVINLCIPKTHNLVIFTAAVKNMAMGAPLRSPIKENPGWSDKRKVHVAGYHQSEYNMFLMSQRLSPFWGATVLDGFEAMEGNGPVGGTLVPWKIAMASRDYIAADRVAVEAMGIDPKWVGYLQYCEQMGIGNYDLAKIDIRGESIASVKKTFKLHSSTEQQLQWMGPLGPPPPAAPGRGPGQAPGRGGQGQAPGRGGA